MTRDEIIRMARESGFQTGVMYLADGTPGWPIVQSRGSGCIVEIEAFAALVAAAEREACALVCDAQAETHELLSNTQAVKGCDDCATAIRARGSNVP